MGTETADLSGEDLMNIHPVTARIRGFLTEHFPSARQHVLGEDDHLLANGILDSLGVLDLVGYLEQEFGISISDDDLLPEHFETLRRLTAFVEEKQSVGSR
jgi:acyl carrier protein